MRIAAAAVMSRKQNHLKTNVIFFVSVVMLLLPAQKLRFESAAHYASTDTAFDNYGVFRRKKQRNA